MVKVYHELRELQRQLQVAAVADAVNGLAQDGAAGGDPVLLGLADVYKRQYLHRISVRRGGPVQGAMFSTLLL